VEVYFAGSRIYTYRFVVHGYVDVLGMGTAAPHWAQYSVEANVISMQAWESEGFFFQRGQQW